MQSAPKISGSVEMSGSTSVSFMGHSPDQGVFGACSNRCGHVASWISACARCRSEGGAGHGRGVAADGHGKGRLKDAKSPTEAYRVGTPQYLVSVTKAQNYS